jgi:hypothetical protein
MHIVGHSEVTIQQWGAPSKAIPRWVKSWLENYEKAKKYDELKKQFKLMFENNEK